MKQTWDAPATDFFYLEFRSTKNGVPSASEICESVLRHALMADLEVVFLSTEMPVRFYLDGRIYIAQRGGSTGSPIVLCYQDH